MAKSLDKNADMAPRPRKITKKMQIPEQTKPAIQPAVFQERELKVRPNKLRVPSYAPARVSKAWPITAGCALGFPSAKGTEEWWRQMRSLPSAFLL
mmetsp:Transcript_123140/g.173608  ORF Transcript_123140/g.173608 Transcript_123140/m.173608 type:complete len:96 (-) Transcript_123140:13-300(-)